MRILRTPLFLTLFLLFAWLPFVASAQLADGLLGSVGSTVGPDGALYVTQGATGEVTRIDPETGDKAPFAENLPPFLSFIGLGGPIDVAFLDGTAYVLVSLTDPFALGPGFGFEPQGVYRVDGFDTATLVADLGAWSAANPPANQFDLPGGVPYAIEAFRGGLLVTDGHHDRVLRVEVDGNVSEFYVGIDIVPTGLETWGRDVLIAQAGVVPHVAEDGGVVSVDAKTGDAFELASGARLAVDVEFGLGRTLYILSQGEWNMMGAGSPALPFTGALYRVENDGAVTELISGLNLPSSLEVIGDTAYVVNLAGEVWRFEGFDQTPPFGVR